MANPNQKLRPMKVRTRERMAQAMTLRIAGATFEQIGKELGCSKQRACQLVDYGYTEKGIQCAQSAEVLRAMEADRLDAMHLRLWPQVNAGDQGAVNTVLRIMERRAKLYGFDAPDALALLGPNGGPVQTQAVDLDLSGLSDEELALLQKVMGKAKPVKTIPMD
jgi:hypothetical protein